MSSRDRPPPGSGNARLAVGVLATWPGLVATYAHAAVIRQRFAREDAVGRALRALGLHELAARPLTARVLGSGKSNAVVAVDVEGGPRLVLKRALPFGSLMAWGARHFGANFVYAADTRGPARIAREADALRYLDAQGIAVPRCVASSPADELLALAWIDGEPVARALYDADGLTLATDVGRLFRRVHDLGVTLADGHPGNLLRERGTGRLVLFDLEFAERDASVGRRGFDLAYAAVLVPTAAHVTAMLDGYGPRAAAERDAFERARAHVLRYRRLVDMERARWAPR